MMKCPACGARYSAAQRLCPKDGAVLEPDETHEDRLIGTILDGKYRLDAFLSRGGMGAVFRGTHVMLNRPVAVKMINPDLVTSPEIVRRFQREARAATQLTHPNVVDVYDLGQTADGTLYIVMELVSGRSLKEVIRTSGPLEPARIVRILGQVCEGLALAHRRNIVHRDLKPQNIMLARDAAGAEVAKIVDFGIAKTFEPDAHTQLTAEGSTLGTPHYMSPEQATGREVDGRSDIYSLGVILYEMLTGEVPFSDPSLPSVLVKHMTEAPQPPSLRRPDLHVPPALEAIALRCLAKAPTDRFETAEVLAGVLRRALPESAGEVATMPLSAPAPGEATVPLAAPTTPGASAPAPPPAAAVPSAPAAVQRSVAVAAAAAPGEAGAAPATGTHPTAPAAASLPPPAPAATRGPGRALLALAAALIVVVGAAAGAWWLVARSAATTEPPAAADGDVPPPAWPAAAVGEPPAAPPVPAEAPAAGRTRSDAGGVAGPTSTVGSATSPPVRGEVQRPAGAAASAPAPAGTGPAAASRPASEAPVGGAAGARATPAVAASLPEAPSVSFACSGAAEVCGPLRIAFQETASRRGLSLVRGGAEIALAAHVEVLEERVDRQFGTTMVVRTYATEIEAEAARFNELVPMPAARTFSADARLGAERFNEFARQTAAAALDRAQEYWAKKR